MTNKKFLYGNPKNTQAKNAASRNIRQIAAFASPAHLTAKKIIRYKYLLPGYSAP
ncbi:hypothetical protein [Pedobacter hartonius]|uniref:Uncharacterized protein n=1 Tax=Pedobacter hartonius TaxID=425514 RepID=A0A1H4HFH6_9SPHI|nr:hypothetical protein [Pedobacter hartonius]SEB20619.1 hypothetical protein SAMN05443550_11714 [Pedobacter hartonius]